MSDTRFIGVSEEQALVLEDIGIELLRGTDPRASLVLSLVLLWRQAPRVREVVAAERMLDELDSERARLRVLEGGA